MCYRTMDAPTRLTRFIVSSDQGTRTLYAGVQNAYIMREYSRIWGRWLWWWTARRHRERWTCRFDNTPESQRIFQTSWRNGHIRGCRVAVEF